MELEICNLAAIEESFRVGQRDALLDLRGFAEDMVADLMRKLSDGKVTRRNLKSQANSSWKGFGRAAGVLKKTLVATGKDGIDHVSEELERQ